MGLTSVLIPILLHFWNKKADPPIKVGSIRRFESDSKEKAKRFHFKNIPLLLSRMVLLALFSVLAAGLFYPKTESIKNSNKNVLLIDYDMKDSEILSKLLIGLDSTKLQFFYTNETDDKDYWSELSTFKGKQFIPDTVIFIGYQSLKNFKGKKRNFPFHVDWKLIPFEKENRLRIKNSKTNLLSESNEEGMAFVISDEEEQAENFALKDSLNILNLLDNNHPAFYKVKAAIEILKNQSPYHFIESNKESAFEKVSINILLTDQNTEPEDEELNPDNTIYFEQSSKYTISQLKQIQENKILISDFSKKDPDLVYKIANLIYDNIELENFIQKHDSRNIPNQQLSNQNILKKNKKDTIIQSKKISLANPLWILIGLSLLIERFLAFKSKREKLEN